MSDRARELASHLEVFNKRLLDFLTSLSEEQLDRTCPWEGYSIRAVAGHIVGDRHYGLLNHVREFFLTGVVPRLGKDAVNTLANKDLEAHSRQRTQDLLNEIQENGEKAISFISGLTDEQLAMTGMTEPYGKDVTVEQFVDWIVIGTSVEHLENMRRIAV